MWVQQVTLVGLFNRELLISYFLFLKRGACCSDFIGWQRAVFWLVWFDWLSASGILTGKDTSNREQRRQHEIFDVELNLIKRRLLYRHATHNTNHTSLTLKHNARHQPHIRKWRSYTGIGFLPQNFTNYFN